MWNLPNSLTVSRIGLIPILVAVLLTKFPGREYLGLGIFLLAGLTDFLDGYFARRNGETTTIGALLDPIADKLLMSAAFISLVELNLAPSWIVTCIVGREFAVTALRMIALEKGRAIAANSLGKVKTTTQIIAISILILGKELGTWIVLGRYMLWVALVATLWSMLVYFWQNRDVLRESPES